MQRSIVGKGSGVIGRERNRVWILEKFERERARAVLRVREKACMGWWGGGSRGRERGKESQADFPLSVECRG